MIFSLLLLLSSIIPSIWNILQFIYIKKKITPIKENERENEHKRFSIIVAVKDENVNTIKELIDNLLSLDYEDYEIIIVSDDPPDKFQQLFSDIPHNEKLKIVNRKPKGRKAGALNYGVSLAKFEYLVFLDADARVDRDFLKNISKYNFDAIAFRIKIYNAKTKTQKYYEKFTEIVMNSLFKTRYYLGLPIFPNGSALCIKKSILQKIGGWKEGTITEDLELGIRLFLQGYRVKYIDEIEVNLLAPFTLHDLYIQIERWAYGSGQLFFESLKMLRKGIKGIEGIFYAQQWGIYGLYIVALLLFSSLNFIFHIPIIYFIISLLIYGISTGLYAISTKQKVDSLSLPLTLLHASVIGYIKGLFRFPLRWRVTPKQMENKKEENQKIKIFLPFILILAFTDLKFNLILPFLILYVFSFTEAFEELQPYLELP